MTEPSPDMSALQQARGSVEEGARLDLAARAADLGIWDWDLTTQTMIYSDRARAIYGFPPDHPVTHEQVRTATHPDDRPRTSAAVRRALDPLIREHEPYEYRIVWPDGSIRWVLAHGQAVFETVNGVEKAVRYVGTIQDVTRQRETEQALQESESRLRLALDAGRIAVWDYVVATETLILSPELKRLLGYPENATPSVEELREGYHPEDRERVSTAGAEALARGQRFFQIEYRYVRRDGSIRWLSLRAEIQLGQSGNPERVIGVVLDITDQKRALERQELLIDELNHRVKNTLATVQSITSQTMRHAANMAEAKEKIESRLMALARAHDLLSEEGWEHAAMTHTVERAVMPLVHDSERIHMQGPELSLTPRSALDLTMVLQELATNALKYGALSGRGGVVDIAWRMDRGEGNTVLEVTWSESGGPQVERPARRGFGSNLIRALAGQDGGNAHIEFNPSGIVCTVKFVITAER
ncbi:MAG TPA: PAS domain-containing protein [Pseudolabrys sp.]|jgi:PAS domain S-box-containing protein|nr:PAS domain-containing protein [Pseudolabrys sp.]